jgi:hypothetical protein
MGLTACAGAVVVVVVVGMDVVVEVTVVGGIVVVIVDGGGGKDVVGGTLVVGIDVVGTMVVVAKVASEDVVRSEVTAASQPAHSNRMETTTTHPVCRPDIVIPQGFCHPLTFVRGWIHLERQKSLFH